MAAEGQASDLVYIVELLGASVVAVAIFKRLGLGSVLGYLAAGLALGPHGLRLFTDPQRILHIAELGVVMFLFIIGLEMRPSHLWKLRRDIFGLGTAQFLACGGLLTVVGWAAGLAPKVAFIAAMGFLLSSTAIVMQILDESGDTSTAHGQRTISILLFEDLAIVPLLALVAFLGPGHVDADVRWRAIATGVAAIAGLVIAGRWLLNPMFRLLARAGAREILTASALLVVLGAALAMQMSGLSMAMGAFLAGVMLSESTFRHQLEAEIEPFRGLLLGLFFLSVGMSLELPVIMREWQLIVAGVASYMLVKSLGIYGVARLFMAGHGEALTRATLLTQGGEFAFVLYAAAGGAGILAPAAQAALTAVVILSMALTPLAVLIMRRLTPAAQQSMDGIEHPDHLHGQVLIVGFGRFAQVVSQALLARGITVSIIDRDTDMIRSAAKFGFKVYYGDGTHLPVLHASGAGSAAAIMVCIDDRAGADKIVQLAKAAFPQARLLVRAYDRSHAKDLLTAGVDFYIRELFESAMTFGETALKMLGVPEAEAAEIVADVRRRDGQRLKLELAGGAGAGIELIRGNILPPVPFTQPKQSSKALSDETAAVIEDATAAKV